MYNCFFHWWVYFYWKNHYPFSPPKELCCLPPLSRSELAGNLFIWQDGWVNNQQALAMMPSRAGDWARCSSSQSYLLTRNQHSNLFCHHSCHSHGHLPVAARTPRMFIISVSLGLYLSLSLSRLFSFANVPLPPLPPAHYPACPFCFHLHRLHMNPKSTKVTKFWIWVTCLTPGFVRRGPYQSVLLTGIVVGHEALDLQRGLRKVYKQLMISPQWITFNAASCHRFS